MNALELLYGTSDVGAIVKQKTDGFQERALASSVRGKVNLTADECKKMCKKIGLDYLPGYEERVLQYRITDATKDRYGDKVVAKGGDLAAYQKNPVVQFAHDYGKLPVGNSLQTKYVRADDAIFALSLFFDDRMDTSGMSDLVYRFASSGAMKACSIGFVPIEYTIPNNEEERAKLDVGPYGVVFDKWELIEFSAVPVPANPNALQDDVVSEFRKSLRSGLFTAKDVRTLMEYPVFSDDQLDAFVKELGDAVIVKPTFVDKAIDAIETTTTADDDVVIDGDGDTVIIDGKDTDEVTKQLSDVSNGIEEVRKAQDAIDTEIADIKKQLSDVAQDLSALAASLQREQTADESKKEKDLYRQLLGLDK